MAVAFFAKQCSQSYPGEHISTLSTSTKQCMGLIAIIEGTLNLWGKSTQHWSGQPSPSIMCRGGFPSECWGGGGRCDNAGFSGNPLVIYFEIWLQIYTKNIAVLIRYD